MCVGEGRTRRRRSRLLVAPPAKKGRTGEGGLVRGRREEEEKQKQSFPSLPPSPFLLPLLLFLPFPFLGLTFINFPPPSSFFFPFPKLVKTFPSRSLPLSSLPFSFPPLTFLSKKFRYSSPFFFLSPAPIPLPPPPLPKGKRKRRFFFASLPFDSWLALPPTLIPFTEPLSRTIILFFQT